jgi:two-component system, chemotaxis family, chemotaxis protein CheY
VSLNVMIVDDSPAMRTFIRRILDLSGVDVDHCIEANDGQEALELLQSESVNIVLTDINMPRLNGEELMRRIAADARLSQIPAIVVSTDRTESRLQQMLALGARGYITKPFSPEVLKDEIERVLEIMA